MYLLKSKKRQIPKYTAFAGTMVFLVWFFFFSLPPTLFDSPYSKALYSQEGELLNAQVAADQQWRFPQDRQPGSKFEQCILTFEDRGFYHHPGISFTGFSRALLQNMKHGKIVSGGSTITMQTVRLMRGNPPRTLREKLLEMILALRLEMRCSKQEILTLYTGHAPFGNNVVGLNAASWRFFGKKPDDLSWSQNALLAVLPNAPSLLYPGKNHNRLMEKRNRLLYSLYQQKIIDYKTLQLSMAELVPEKPLPLPDLARHYFSARQKNKSMVSTLNFRIQQQCQAIADNYARRYYNNQVQNIAIIVRETRTGKTIAYLGNTKAKWNSATAFVDCAKAPRSTGSILKPLLYYKCLSSGMITSESMLMDVPVSYNNFRPQNYARSFEGLVKAREALTKSLNIPMVGLLQEYGLPRFHSDLQQMGFKYFGKPASHYGLSLILGSGEVSLDELSRIYSNWASHLYTQETADEEKACIYETLEAMSALNRPDENGNWKAFVNTQKIAWKTGTSFGNRDAWCIGISPAYTVSVWVGNADGSGRTSLTGIEYAAPVLFDIFNTLPKTYQWFPKPKAGYQQVLLCKTSGYKAGHYCDDTLGMMLPATALQAPVCPFHQMLSVNDEETFRVTASIYDWRRIKQKNYFVLPPNVIPYFKAWNPDFKLAPPWHPYISCVTNELSIIYPNKSKILLFGPAMQMDIVFKATNASTGGIVYWHIDDEYVGATTSIHEIKYTLPAGKHTLSILDQYGNQQQTTFEIIRPQS